MLFTQALLSFEHLLDFDRVLDSGLILIGHSELLRRDAQELS